MLLWIFIFCLRTLFWTILFEAFLHKVRKAVILAPNSWTAGPCQNFRVSLIDISSSRCHVQLCLFNSGSFKLNWRNEIPSESFFPNLWIIVYFLVYLVGNMLVHLSDRDSFYLFKVIKSFLLFNWRFLYGGHLLIFFNHTFIICSTYPYSKCKRVWVFWCRGSRRKLMNTLKRTLINWIIILFNPWLINSSNSRCSYISTLRRSIDRRRGGTSKFQW